MADIVLPQRRNTSLFVLGGILFGAVAFFAGRLSVHPKAAPVNPSSSAITATQIEQPRALSPTFSTIPDSDKEKAGPSSGWDENRWDQLSSQPGTVARNVALAAMLEKLAATDPTRAMQLAQAEGNLKTRGAFTQSVLRGWASTAPEKAADWVLKLPDENSRDTAMASVFAGAIANPDAAARVANSAAEKDPANAIGFGNSLIDTFCNGGNFAAAAQFAAAGDDGNRSFWLAEAYSKWSALQPEQAAQAAAAITDPAIRSDALHGIVGGWSEADPVGLTSFIAQLPEGGERGQMLGQALQSWARLDPAAVADWINNNSDEGADMDQGISSVATLNTIQPDLAVNWAQSITDGKLRSETLTDILRNWVLTDFPAARSFYETTHDLQPANRQVISEIVTSIASGQTATQ